MDEKEMLTKSEDTNTKMPKLELIGTLGSGEDDTIVIPVSEYKHLVKCEAAVDLMFKLLNIYGKYDNTRGEIIAIACALLQKEGSEDAE